MSGTLSFINNVGIYGTMGGGSDAWGICGTGEGDNGRLKIWVSDNATTDYLDFEFRDWQGTIYTPMTMTGHRINCNSPLYGAVYNDYAEYRNSFEEEPGRVVLEDSTGTCQRINSRLSPFAGVVSDTFGFSQGETEDAKIPLAVAGRVLVYPYRNKYDYKIGDCVCTAPNGTVDIMTREEIREWPDRIVGTVSEIPEYEEWGTGKVKVNGRIWIKVK